MIEGRNYGGRLPGSRTSMQNYIILIKGLKGGGGRTFESWEGISVSAFDGTPPRSSSKGIGNYGSHLAKLNVDHCPFVYNSALKTDEL